MTMLMRVAAPVPMSMPNAVARFITGKVTAMPLTTLGSSMACPITTESMMLYNAVTTVPMMAGVE